MNNIRIIDVTLRDGGYKTNFYFSDEEIEKIITSLDSSGIEYIEVGYRNGSARPIKNIGPAGLCDKTYLKKCKKYIKKSKISVMLHPNNVNEDDLRELANCGVDLCRICIGKMGYEELTSLAMKASNLGLKVSANITRISHYSEKDLNDLISKLPLDVLEVVYFADSNGSLLPSVVRCLCKRYLDKYSVPLGFHAHDNLGLAQANAIAAMSSGVKYVDVSLAGAGKGIGNLKTELFLSYLRVFGVNKYDIKCVLKGVNIIQSLNAKQKINFDTLLMGINDMSIDDFERKSN